MLKKAIRFIVDKIFGYPSALNTIFYDRSENSQSDTKSKQRWMILATAIKVLFKHLNDNSSVFNAIKSLAIFTSNILVKKIRFLNIDNYLYWKQAIFHVNR